MDKFKQPLELKDMKLKAECLVHFSYIFSEKFMTLDIQENYKYQLYDPAIATSSLKKKDELLFCAVNLGSHVINTFSAEHKYNDFCSLLKLQLFT